MFAKVRVLEAVGFSPEQRCNEVSVVRAVRSGRYRAVQKGADSSDRLW